ncbi:MAG: HD domain-containing protein [Candidatus Uhrbacteria bacterium]|nr:HD domain-containing protein [Candidatus Uhrbacteria bacterium]MDP3793315.1 HD domain-containing protein [Candidatus Uhrbacteria bacterium]
MRDLEFLYELGSLRNVPRGWRQHLGVDCENDLEHTMRVVWIALIIARRMGVKNEEKIIKMALTHDLAESRTADHSYVQKLYVDSNEAKAVHDIFDRTVFSDMEALVKEYEERECVEAKIVKDADNLDIDLELKELEERGHQGPSKWKEQRRMIREEKLYTDAAKQLWDEIQTSDPASWHLNNNKWMHQPNAGK